MRLNRSSLPILLRRNASYTWMDKAKEPKADFPLASVGVVPQPLHGGLSVILSPNHTCSWCFELTLGWNLISGEVPNLVIPPVDSTIEDGHLSEKFEAPQMLNLRERPSRRTTGKTGIKAS